MYYILVLFLAIIVFYAVLHFVSSLLKGCLITVFVVFIGMVVYMYLLSAREPVRLFDLVEIDNFKLMKVVDK